MLIGTTPIKGVGMGKLFDRRHHGPPSPDGWSRATFDVLGGTGWRRRRFASPWKYEDVNEPTGSGWRCAGSSAARRSSAAAIDQPDGMRFELPKNLACPCGYLQRSADARSTWDSFTALHAMRHASTFGAGAAPRACTRERAIRLSSAAFASPEILPRSRMTPASAARSSSPEAPRRQAAQNVRRWHASFSYQAGTWASPALVAKVEVASG